MTLLWGTIAPALVAATDCRPTAEPDLAVGWQSSRRRGQGHLL